MLGKSLSYQGQQRPPFVVTRKEEWREDYVTPFKGRLIPAHLHVERVTRSIRFKPVKCECCNRPAHRCAN